MTRLVGQWRHNHFVTTVVLRSDPQARIKGIFTGQVTSEQFLSFQVFERRRLLSSKGFSLIISSNTFKRLEDPGLILDDKLTALYVKGRLYFRSYFFARRILDLSEYYRQATDQDLSKFVEHPKVFFDSRADLLSTADAWIRRKVAIIQDSGILDRETPRKIAELAKLFSIELGISSKGGSERLTFPTGKKELKAALRFLNEDYYDSPLPGRRYVSNSKRVIE